VLDASAAPVIASHSCARALNDSPRNLGDEQLRAIARGGGVVNVNFYSRFLDPVYRAAVERLESAPPAERIAERMADLPSTPFALLIDHIEHVARVAGVEHTGIGSDFDGVSALPLGMEDVTGLPRIAQALLDRGYADDDVRKVLGGNMLRVMTQVLDRR
jgi:membrane dipeptidase